MAGILLQVRNLKTYFFTKEGVVRAVDDVSFDLEEGETMGLVGESGCGKSVSALSIMRLVPNPGRIVAGEILFEGKDLLKLSPGEMRQVRGHRIAMVFQEPMTSLNPVLTIGRQLTETLEFHLKMDRKRATRRAVELLEMVGIPEPEKRLRDYPHQFSGGMRQRVMIAIAISCNPRLLIADEPTTALDVTIQAQILELMKHLTQELGASLLLITHNLGVVARYTDRVSVMYAGKIVETGYAADIYGDPKHPYTLGLLTSVPRLDRPRQERLWAIEGQPPDLSMPVSGCSFRPRCPYAVTKCGREAPPLLLIEGRHSSACWEAQRIGTKQSW